MRLPPLSQPSAQRWQTLNNSVLLRCLLLFGCGWTVVVLINYFHTTIALFTATGLLAALLNYPVVWLSRSMPRWLAIALTFLGAIALLLGLLLFIGLQVLSQGQGLIAQLGTVLNAPYVLPIGEPIDLRSLVDPLRTGLIISLGLVQNLFSNLFMTIFGVVICLYMVIDGSKLWRICLQVIPEGGRDRFGTIFQQSFLGFLRGTLLIMLFLSSTSLLAFLLLGVDYALLLAVMVGLLDAIPGIGAILGMVVATFLVLVSQGWVLALKVLAVSLVLEQTQENYVRPKVMGDTLDLNPVLLFLALFIGQRVAGLLGVFLALPIAGMIGAWIQASRSDRASFLDGTSTILEKPDKHEPN